MKIDPNSPAFPQSVNVSTQHGHYTNVTAHPGLTIRAEFAKAAMQGFLANPEFGMNNTTVGIASEAVAQADALIAALNARDQSRHESAS